MTAKEKDKYSDIKLGIAVVLFLLSFAGSVGSYFKTTYDIKYELQAAMRDWDKSLRMELRALYATKEETKFQHEKLEQIQKDIDSIHQKLDNL